MGNILFSFYRKENCIIMQLGMLHKAHEAAKLGFQNP